MESSLNNDMDMFKTVLMDLVRAAGAQIRPLVKPEAVLELQEAFDDLKRRTVPAAAVMVKNSQGALLEAQVQIFNYKKMQGVLKQMRQRGLHKAFNKWADHVSEETTAETSKFNQPNVQALLKRVLSAPGIFYLRKWMHAGAIRHKRVKEEELMKKRADSCDDLEAQLDRLRDRRMKEVLKRILNRELSKAFSKWKSVAYQAKVLLTNEELTNIQSEIKQIEAQFTASKKDLDDERIKSLSLEETCKKSENQHLALEARAQALEERARIDLTSMEGSMHAELNSMADEVTKLKQQQLHFVTRKWMRRTYRHHFDEWVEIWRFNRHGRKAIGQMANRSLAKAFHRWVETVQERHKLHRKLLKLAGRLAYRTVTRAFKTWVDAGREAKKTRLMLQRCARKLEQRQLTTAYNRWVESAQTAKQMRMLLARCAKKMLNKVLGGAYNRWVEYSNQIKEIRLLLGRCARKVMNRQLSSSWEKWYELIEKKMQAKKHSNIAVAGAFSQWKDMLEEIMEQRVKVSRSLGKLMYRVMDTAFEMFYQNWQVAVTARHRAEEDKKALEARMRKFAVKMQNKNLMCAFERWDEFTQGAKKMRVLLTRCANKLRNRAVASAFNRWCEMTVEAANTRVNITRALSKMRQRALMSVWERWLLMLDESDELRVKLKRSAMKMLTRELTGAFSRWAAFAVEAMKMRAKVERAVAKMTKREMTSAFHRWEEQTAEGIRRRRVLVRAVQKMRARVVSGAFAGWAAYFVEAVELRVKLTRFAQRLKGSMQVGAFTRWAEMTAEARQMRYLLKKVAMKLQKRQLAAALTRWKELWSEMCRLRQVGNKVVRRIARQKLFGVWNTWCEFMEGVYRLRKSTDDDEGERLRIEGRQRKIASRMVNGQLAESFDGWRVAVQRRKNQRELVTKSLLRLQRVLLHSTFKRWEEMAEEARVMRAKVARILGKIMQRELAGAFQSWLDVMVDSRGHTAKMEDIMAKAVHKLTQAKLSAAFSRWHDYAVERTGMRRRLKMAVMRMMQRVLAASFLKWVGFIEDSEGQRVQTKQVMAKAVGKFISKFLGPAFARWKEMTTDHQMQRRILMGTVARIKSRQLATAWARWNAFIVELHEVVERKRRHQERVIARFLKGTLAKAWRTWHDNCQELVHMRKVVAGALRRMTVKVISAAFNKWYELIEERRETEAKLTKALIRMRNMCIASAFTKWEGMVRRKRNARLKAIGTRQMQLGAGEFAAPIIEQIRQMATDGKALLERPKPGGLRRTSSEAVMREVSYRIEGLSRLQFALKSGFVDDPTFKPVDPDDSSVRENIAPEIDGAKAEILDELGRLHDAMTSLSLERQALQSQMASMLNLQRGEERKMMYVFRHKLAEELQQGEDDLQSRLGRLVNSMRAPNWFINQRKKIEDGRARAAEEQGRREKTAEDSLPPVVTSEDITASANYRPRTDHRRPIVEANEHHRRVPLTAQDSLTGRGIRRLKSTLQEEFKDNTAQALAMNGSVDINMEVLISRTALQRAPAPLGGLPKPAGTGRKLVPRVAMTAPSSKLWKGSGGTAPGGKRNPGAGAGAGEVAWGSPSTSPDGNSGANVEGGFVLPVLTSLGAILVAAPQQGRSPTKRFSLPTMPLLMEAPGQEGPRPSTNADPPGAITTPKAQRRFSGSHHGAEAPHRG
jgi:hypothetical protein